jgi:hypothetical protein
VFGADRIVDNVVAEEAAPMRCWTGDIVVGVCKERASSRPGFAEIRDQRMMDAGVARGASVYTDVDKKRSTLFK